MVSDQLVEFGDPRTAGLSPTCGQIGTIEYVSNNTYDAAVAEKDRTTAPARDVLNVM